jgi:hypothetical protein
MRDYFEMNFLHVCTCFVVPGLAVLYSLHPSSSLPHETYQTIHT